MNIGEFSYLWTDMKEEYVLVKTDYGYGIVNKTRRSILSVSDEEPEMQWLRKCLKKAIRYMTIY